MVTLARPASSDIAEQKHYYSTNAGVKVKLHGPHLQGGVEYTSNAGVFHDCSGQCGFHQGGFGQYLEDCGYILIDQLTNHYTNKIPVPSL